MPNKTVESQGYPVRLLLVAPDNRLTRLIRADDRENRFEIVRFRDFEKARQRARTPPGCALIVQWTVEEILDRLSQGVPPRVAPLFVYCPELPQKTVTEGEEIRFALLQYGATAVFSQRRKLPGFLDMIGCYARRFPPPEKHWTQAVEESLPWKTA